MDDLADHFGRARFDIGRAVRDLLLYFGLCALQAQKPKYSYNAQYDAAAG